MDHPYQTTMQLPAAYAVITEEEMTYLEGGSKIVLGNFLGSQWTLDTDQFMTFCSSIVVNFSYYLLSASFNYVTGIIESGLNSGLSLAGSILHQWSKLQTPWSRIGAIGITGMAGLYAGVQAVSIYRTFKSLYDSIVNPMPDFSGATPQTAAA